MQINIQKLERERSRLGMTKAQFSDHFGLSISTYSKILSNKSTALKTLTKIAVMLDLDPKDLLTN
jgi:transcriptional regulator with XRE-family HTH domain